MYKLLRSCQDKRIQKNNVKPLSCNFLQKKKKKKKNAWVQVRNQKIFRIEGEVWNYGTSINPQGNMLELFLLDILKTTFWMETLIQRWTQSRLFSLKSRHLFRFSKGSILPPLYLRACEYGWICISLNILKHPWKCSRATQSFENVWLWLHMPQYCLNMPRNALIPLSIPEHGWILLNVHEYDWLNRSDYARVFNMPRYSYNNNIIIVTVIIFRILVCSICTFMRYIHLYIHSSFLTRVRTEE